MHRVRVAVAQGVALAGRHEAFARVLVDRLEHREPHVAMRVVADPDEALLGELLQAVEHRRAAVPRERAHVLGDVQGSTAREHGQPREHPPRVLVEEVVAPFDGSAERPLALGQVPAAAREEPEPVVEPPRDPARAEEPDARGGELDRERQPVEPPDDLRHVGGVVGGEREVRADGHRPLHEQPHGLGRPDLGDSTVEPSGGRASGGTGNSCSPAIRSGARLDTITVRAGAARRRSATIPAPSTTCSKLSSTSSTVRGREVLADHLDGHPVRGQQPDRGGDRGRDEVRVRHGRERHEPGPVGEPSTARVGELDRQAGLAGAARPREGQEPGPFEQRRRPLDLRPADEAR